MPLRWLRVRGVFLVLVAASSWPLHILAVNFLGIVRPERVIGIVLLVWSLGMLLVAVLVACRLDVESAENTAFAAVLFAMNGGPILAALGSLGYVLMVGCLIAVGLLSFRMREHWMIRALVWGTAVAVAVGPFATLVDSWNSRGGPSVVQVAEPTLIELETKPDIFLVVLDGYPGSIASELDGLDPGTVDFEARLDALGFHRPRSSWAAYWTTTLSIPSILEMGYPVEQSEWLGLHSQRDLQVVLSGQNATIELLKGNGYQIHMIESGWSAASCGHTVDRCMPSPLIDEATFLILDHTIASTFLERSPGPYVLGALAGFDRLIDGASELSRSDTPDFTFMHVVSPHPPLLLASDCSVDLTPGRAGTQFDVPGVSTDLRERYLIEQMDCLENRMLELAASVEPDDIVIFVSDHGTDRRHQADPEVVEWGHDMIVERLNNFLAIRSPNCSIPDEVVAPNVLRIVLGCLASSPIEILPERMWINPMVELDPGLVDELLGMRTAAASDRR